MTPRKLLTAAAPLLLAGLLGAAAPGLVRAAQGWKPWQFGTNEHYEFTIHDHTNPEAKPVGVVLDLRPAGASEGGEELVTVSYTTATDVPASELGPQTAFGGAAGMGMGLGLMLINPMIVAFMDQVTLEVGEKMALFGAGRIEVTAREEIAGVEGFVCRYLGPKEQGEPLLGEWVVHPDVAIPLRSVTYDAQGKKAQEIVMTRFQKR